MEFRLQQKWTQLNRFTNSAGLFHMSQCSSWRSPKTSRPQFKSKTILGNRFRPNQTDPNEWLHYVDVRQYYFDFSNHDGGYDDFTTYQNSLLCQFNLQGH